MTGAAEADLPDLTALSLEDKAALLSGASFWATAELAAAGVPSIVLTDGPHGVRRQAGEADHLGLNESAPATAFPTASATGSSWDPDLLEEIGVALALEARALGVHVLLGPGVNIKRSPLCGRNFEYFSEDPRLSGALASAWVRGLQSVGVAACVKHFAANNQETNRMRVSAQVDERTLREIYLPAFEEVVAAGVQSVMCSYNAVNKVPAAENHRLLTEVLRDDWGFDGFVVSDWGAVSDPVASVRAGLDLEMPATNGASAAKVVDAVRAGTLDEAVVDRAAARMVTAARSLAEAAAGPDRPVDLSAHHALARRAAAASAVLLTNDGVLPLDPGADGPVAVIGGLARSPRYQGAGSSHIVPTRLDDPVEELRAALPDRELRVADGYRLDGAPDPALVADAVAAARDAASVVLFLGLPESEESEGFDREHLDLPGVQLDLLRAVADVHERVVVVLGNGGVVRTRPVEELAGAVLETWLGGQAVGGAIADLLTGAAEPGGRLAETIPLALADTPAYVNFPGTAAEVLYGERVYVGYRWYDRVERPVTHAFGHGLGYTTWAYDDLEVVVPDPTVAAATVRFRLTNTGERTGSEVAQVYLADPVASLDRPVRELVGFRKVTLEPGASTVVEITLDERCFSFFDAERGGWRVEPGEFVVSAGASSADLRLSASLELDVAEDLGPLTVDSPMGDWLARPGALAALMEAFAAATGAEAEMPELDADLLRMVESMPLRQVLGMAGVQLDEEGERALVAKAEEQPA